MCSSASPAHRSSFSWAELLVLVTVLGFLAAVLWPTLNFNRRKGKGTVIASNIRAIGQSSLIYANDNRGQLPGLSLDRNGTSIIEGYNTPNIHAIAGALARQGGLNDAQIWIASQDQNRDINRKNLTTVLGSSRYVLSPEFTRTALSYQYVAGLNTEMSSRTPIAFTRGLQTDGKWAADRNISVLGSDGGHIVFLGGNVAFYHDLGDLENVGSSFAHPGLVTPDGTPTVNILETIDSSIRIFSEPATQTGALDGMPGTGKAASE